MCVLRSNICILNQLLHSPFLWHWWFLFGCRARDRSVLVGPRHPTSLKQKFYRRVIWHSKNCFYISTALRHSGWLFCMSTQLERTCGFRKYTERLLKFILSSPDHPRSLYRDTTQVCRVMTVFDVHSCDDCMKSIWPIGCHKLFSIS